MERKSKRTITEVLNYETGECINADEFFRKPLDELSVFRSELQKAIEGIRDTLFACYYCKQKVRIRGGLSAPHKRKAEIFHFAHLKDSDDCHIKTKNQFTKEEVDRIKYNGAKESHLHLLLKNQIAESLRRNQETKNEISKIEIEKVIRDKVDKEWKKPDINAFFQNKRIAIELQLSTTWLDVITRRQYFYKEHGIYILWIFHAFNTNDDVRKLTYNDVIYTNNQNAYVFDKETYELSKAENDLILKCYYKTYFRDEQRMCELWKYSIIKLSELTFDDKSLRVFYHDTETQKRNVEQEIKDYIKELCESDRLRILKEQEQKRKQQELISKMEDLNDVINGIKERQYKTKINENIAKRKLGELYDFNSQISDVTDKVINYFKANLNFSKPFYEHDDLLKLLREIYAEKIESSVKIIAQKQQDQDTLLKNILSIKKLPIIEIGGVKYSSINPSTDWNFIQLNYFQIKTINKNLVGGLFASDEMRPIKTDYDLRQLKYLKDTLFLMDFSSKVVEFELQMAVIQGVIKEQENLVADLRYEIKEKIEKYIRGIIIEKEEVLKKYFDIQAKLSNDLAKRENQLANLNKQ
jgi:competence CoiA-like predicted nuclease